MTEQKNLVESSEDDLNTAKYLLEGDKYNASISRSYYAVFYAAKALLMEKDSKPKTHQGVSSELGKLFREDLSPELTSKYSQIQTWREEADYSTGKDFGIEKAEEAIEFAEMFIRETKNIIGKS